MIVFIVLLLVFLFFWANYWFYSSLLNHNSEEDRKMHERIDQAWLEAEKEITRKPSIARRFREQEDGSMMEVPNEK